MKRRSRIAVLYHYMHPDDVVSALHFDHLAHDLASKGWDVEALPCNRGCRDETQVYQPSETYQGVSYRRVWRPNFSQKSFWGRLLNSSWMIASWSRLALRRRGRRPDIVIVGTDPVFAAVTAIPIRFFARDIRLVHWCFDMHPEAAVAAKLVTANSLQTHLMRKLMRKAYHSFDLIADIGACMRERLREYGHNAIECELTPWALVEPKSHCTAIDQSTRYELFGHSQIGLLYSGNFGEAHEFSEFLALARALRQNENIHFCFAIRGNQAEAFRKAVTTDDINISFAPFAKIEDLEKRLNSADIHLVSLKENWAGLAVPSKFFGSLASAKPILYSGSKKSAIGTWITQHKIGRTIDPNNILQTVDWIEDLAKEPSKLSKLQRHCHSLYQAQFSRRSVVERWDKELKMLLVE